MTRHTHYSRLSSLLLLASVFVFCAPGRAASTPKRFPSAEEAAKAFVAACSQQDVPALQAMLGPGGESLINSGDEAQDQRRRERFATLATESLEIRPDPYFPDRSLIYVGSRHWPLPIPIVKKDDGYGFDPVIARTEILARRVGHNELDAIEFLHGFVQAEVDFAYSDLNNNGMRDYAQNLVSTPGTHDGLYWPAEEGKPDSPGEVFAEQLIGEGYDLPAPGEPLLFHGYVFKILKAQGPHAPDGAREYVAHDFMIGGFAMVAYPVEYAVSGVKTFVVNQDGVVWEKDLGAKTKAIASAMKAYDPDKTWMESPRAETEDQSNAKP